MSETVTIQRNYSLTEDELQRLRDYSSEHGLDYLNPHRSGIYKAIIDALGTLGVNRWHKYIDFENAVRECLGEEKWKIFKEKPSQYDETGRLMGNCKTLQRIGERSGYGKKLRQCCQCIDLKYDDKDGPMLRLNTQFSSFEEVEPIKIIKKGGRNKKMSRHTEACGLKTDVDVSQEKEVA